MTPHGRAWIGGGLVGVLALASLLSTAAHADTTAGRLLSGQDRREAAYSNAYWSCLQSQGHQLLRAGDVVYLAQHDLYHWVMVTKAVGGFVRLTEQRAHATVALFVASEPHGHGPTCDGQALVTIRATSAGRVVMRRAGMPVGGSS